MSVIQCPSCGEKVSVKADTLVKSVHTDEDSLTATVFGELRYLPPQFFWPSLFRKAECCNGQHTSLLDYLGTKEISLASCQSLDIKLWPSFSRTVGRPDLLLTFGGGGGVDLEVLVEVKLHSPRGGKRKYGRADQLHSYIRWAKYDERRKTTRRVFLYLTPSHTRGRVDLNKAFAAPKSRGSLETLRAQVFTLCWNDVAQSADEGKNSEMLPHPYGMILGGVASYLRRLQCMDLLNPTESIEPAQTGRRELDPDPQKGAAPYFEFVIGGSWG